MMETKKKLEGKNVLDWLKKHLAESSVLFALIIMCIVWSIISPYFLTVGNFRSIFIYIGATGIMAAGLTCTLLTGSMDLSQMPLMAFSGMMIGIANNWYGIHGIWLVLIGIIAGACGGLLNAFTVTILGIVPFIATLGSQLVFRALAFISTDGVYLSVNDDLVRAMTKKNFLGMPIMFWIMMAVFILFWFILKYTQYGRNLYSVGGSQQTAYLSGINVRKTRFIAYVISGACCGLAAFMFVAQGNTALNNAGTGSEMDIMSGVIVGGISLGGGMGSVINTLLGIALLGVITNGMGLVGLTPYYQMLVKGLILVGAVLLDMVRTKGKR